MGCFWLHREGWAIFELVLFWSREAWARKGVLGYKGKSLSRVWAAERVTIGLQREDSLHLGYKGRVWGPVRRYSQRWATKAECWATRGVGVGYKGRVAGSH